MKIVVVGTGSIGAATAFALVLKDVGDEIVLIDSDRRKAEGEAIDLAHASLVNNYTDVYLGSYEDCRDAAIVIITAGQVQKTTDTEQALLSANFKILVDVAPKIGAVAPRALLIVAAHPNEVLTRAAAELSGLPAHRVIGVGTSLDSARFRHEISKYYRVDIRDINAPIVGVHGINEIPLWSMVTIDGLPLKSYCEQVGKEVELDELEECFWKAKRAVFDIMEHKGSPSMSMAAGICAIVEAILRDKHSVMTVAANGDYLGVNGIALSVPTKLSRAGAEHLKAWSDDWHEEDKLHLAAKHVGDQMSWTMLRNFRMSSDTA